MTSEPLPRCVGCGEPTTSRTDDGRPLHVGCQDSPRAAEDPMTSEQDRTAVHRMGREATADIEAERLAVAANIRRERGERTGLDDALNALRAAVMWLDGEYDDVPREQFNREAWGRLARRGIAALYPFQPSALSQPPDAGDGLTGREVHAAWRDGMLAQGRDVPPERMDWATLSIEDRLLDVGIAARLRAALAQEAEPRKDEPDAFREDECARLGTDEDCDPGCIRRCIVAQEAEPTPPETRAE